MGGRILCLQNHNHQFFEIDVRNWEGVLYIYLRVHPILSLCGKLLLRLLPKPADLFALVSVYGEGILVSQVLMLLETSAATRRPPLHHSSRWQLICLPTLHLLSLLVFLRRGFRRTPTNHTMRLTWTFKSFRQGLVEMMCSSDDPLNIT